MASASLDVTGKDSKLILTQNGVLIAVVDQITEFSASATYDEVRTKHLGRSGSRVQKEFVGWEGSLGFTRQNSALDDLIDQLNVFRKNRVPYIMNIAHSIFFRDGSTRGWIYRDVEIEFETSTTRGEADTITSSWVTGNDRVAL